MQIKVLRPGLFTTIQDTGRYGYQKYGVIVSGAMDTYALRVANILIGNDPAEGALEVTVMGPQLFFEYDALIAITGGNLSPTVDGVPIPMWRPVLIKKGCILDFSGCNSGCRAYLAVAGGFDVPDVMGSKSTYCKAGFGGFHGRALRGDDVIKVNENERLSEYRTTLNKQLLGGLLTTSWYVAADYLPGKEAEIRFIRGTQYELFDELSRGIFVSTSFTITMQADRMGYRLSGKVLKRSIEKELISEAVGFGSVQVPPDGNPIILLADRQTAGGYSKIAQIISVDLPILAQLMPGSTVRFKEISHELAEEKFVTQETRLKSIQQGVLTKLS